MLVRRLAATRIARPPLLSRPVATQSLDSEEGPYDNIYKRGHPRTWQGRALPENPANLPLLRLLQESEPIEGTTSQQQTYAINTIACYSKPIKSLEDLKLLRIGSAYRAHIARYVTEMMEETSNPAEAYQQSLNDISSKRSRERKLGMLPYFTPGVCQRLVGFGCGGIEDLNPDNPALWDRLSPRHRKVASWGKYVSQPITDKEVETVLTFLDLQLRPQGWTVIATGPRRRGEPQPCELEVMLLHRTYGHVALPEEVRSSAQDLQWKQLLNNALFGLLFDRGLTAEEFSNRHGVWEGIIRVPWRSEDGRWESRHECYTRLKKREGKFCFMRMRVISTKSAGAALLRSTGDADYVKHISKTVYDLGMYLDDYGLWHFHPNDPTKPLEMPVRYTHGRVKLAEASKDGYWELLPSDTEEQVLSQLNLPYVEPERRNFKNLKTDKS